MTARDLDRGHVLSRSDSDEQRPLFRVGSTIWKPHRVLAPYSAVLSNAGIARRRVERQCYGMLMAPVPSTADLNHDKHRHVAAAIASIEEKFGLGAIQRLGASARPDVQVIPFGLADLDRIIGVGGLPRGRIVEVFGAESAGVSTLLLHAVAAAQRQGGVAALIDADMGFDPEYARRIGIDLDSLFIARPDDGAMALEIVDALVRSTAFDIVAVDSVPALEPPEQPDAEARSSRGARQGRLLSEALRRLAAGVDRTRTVLLFGNHTTAVLDDQSAENTSGGRALPFYASVRIGLKQRGLIRETLSIVGAQVEATTVKNKVAPPLRMAILELIFGNGFVDQPRRISTAVNGAPFAPLRTAQNASTVPAAGWA